MNDEIASPAKDIPTLYADHDDIVDDFSRENDEVTRHDEGRDLKHVDTSLHADHAQEENFDVQPIGNDEMGGAATSKFDDGPPLRQEPELDVLLLVWLIYMIRSSQ
ncbi:unnamed protein product [Linum trigynum]|uniref:Uncharacterized protein n=1 Tax=Linum trigynum TaxID=586398 RepID=A0AAV2FTI4_9ROSI